MEELLTQMLVQMEIQSEIMRGIQEQLKSSQDTQALGFCDPPTGGKLFLNVDRQHEDCLWHSWDKLNECYVPHTQNAIVGKVKEIKIEQGLEFKGKVPEKLKVVLDAGREIILQSGTATIFTRSLCLVLSRLPVEALRSSIGIAVSPGKDEKVVLSRVFNPKSGEYAYVKTPDNVDWDEVVQKAISKVKQANEVF